MSASNKISLQLSNADFSPLIQIQTVFGWLPLLYKCWFSLVMAILYSFTLFQKVYADIKKILTCQGGKASLEWDRQYSGQYNFNRWKWLCIDGSLDGKQLKKGLVGIRFNFQAMFQWLNFGNTGLMKIGGESNSVDDGPWFKGQPEDLSFCYCPVPTLKNPRRMAKQFTKWW